MRPQYHLLISVILSSLFYLFTKSISGSILTILIGVLIDLDHWIDYWIEKGEIKFDIKEFFSYSYECKYTKLHLILHSVEFIPLIFFITNYFWGKYFAFGITLGFVGHLISDYIGNAVKPLSYFLIYRIIKKFDFFNIVDEKRLMKCKKISELYAKNKITGSWKNKGRLRKTRNKRILKENEK